MPAVWIPKREAIALVIAAERDGAVGSRASARGLLARWVRRAAVRTKPGEHPPGNKRPRRLYRRADVARQIASRRARRPWRLQEDVLLGSDVDRVIARRLRRNIWAVAARRSMLGIPAHGAGGGRCNPTSWRLPADDPRLAPPLRATG